MDRVKAERNRAVMRALTCEHRPTLVPTAVSAKNPRRDCGGAKNLSVEQFADASDWIGQAIPGVSTRVRNSIKRVGVDEAMLRSMTDKELLNLRNFGRGSLAEIRASIPRPPMHDPDREDWLLIRALQSALCGWRDEGNNPSCLVCQQPDYEGHADDCAMGAAMREITRMRS